MKLLAKLLACVAILTAPTVAFAGIKWVDQCIRTDFLIWKEYLVGGGQGQPGNELWGLGTDSTCGIELWDLTLIQATSVPAPLGYSAQYVTTYDDGYLGHIDTGGGPYDGVLWNVSGTVTALFETNGMIHSTLDLYGTSTLYPGEHLEAQIVTDFLPVVAGPECLPWNNVQNCQTYLFIGSEHSGSSNPPITSAFVRVVPEPGTLALIGIALAGLGATRRRKQT